MENSFSNLSSHQLFNLVTALAGKDVSVEDKLTNALHMPDICQSNKQFKLQYCDTQRVWRELYRRDISSDLPRENVKELYLQALIQSNTGNKVDDILAAINSGHGKLAKSLIKEANNKELREVLINTDDREMIDYINTL